MSSKQDNQEKVIGIHAVSELLSQSPGSVSQLLIQSGRNDRRINQVRDLASAANIAIREMSKEAFEKDFDGVHQGVAAIAEFENSVLSEKSLFELLQGLDHPPLLLVLDGVTDPHNLGACLRSADGAGVDAVIVPRDRSCGLTPVVRKVASGGADSVPFVLVTNLSRTMEKLRDMGIWIVGAAGEAESCVSEIDFNVPTAVVMGSEDRGLRRLTRENCDYLTRIPMAGSVASLNVSVATGVVLFEAVRQRQADPQPKVTKVKAK